MNRSRKFEVFFSGSSSDSGYISYLSLQTKHASICMIVTSKKIWPHEGGYSSPPILPDNKGLTVHSIFFSKVAGCQLAKTLRKRSGNRANHYLTEGPTFIKFINLEKNHRFCSVLAGPQIMRIKEPILNSVSVQFFSEGSFDKGWFSTKTLQTFGILLDITLAEFLKFESTLG